MAEAKLLMDSSCPSSLQPFVKLIYANQTRKSSKSENSGKIFKWDASHRFTHTGQNTLEVILLHTAYFFSEKEIGRCTISLQEVQSSQWFNLISTKGELAGAILLDFDMGQRQRPEPIAHPGNHSCDVRSESRMLVSPTDNKRRRLPLPQWTPDVKHRQDEAYDLEQVRMVLVQENARLISQEIKLKKAFTKFERDAKKVQQEKMESRELKTVIQEREERLICEKRENKEEVCKIRREKEEVEGMRRELVQEYAKLKQEKLKVAAHQKLLRSSQKKVSQATRQLEVQKALVQRCRENRFSTSLEEFEDFSRLDSCLE